MIPNAQQQKKVIKLFRAEPSSNAERQSLEHLKRFVKKGKGRHLQSCYSFVLEVM